MRTKFVQYFILFFYTSKTLSSELTCSPCTIKDLRSVVAQRACSLQSASGESVRGLLSKCHENETQEAFTIYMNTLDVLKKSNTDSLR